MKQEQSELAWFTPFSMLLSYLHKPGAYLTTRHSGTFWPVPWVVSNTT